MGPRGGEAVRYNNTWLTAIAHKARDDTCGRVEADGATLSFCGSLHVIVGRVRTCRRFRLQVAGRR